MFRLNIHGISALSIIPLCKSFLGGSDSYSTRTVHIYRIRYKVAKQPDKADDNVKIKRIINKSSTIGPYNEFKPSELTETQIVMGYRKLRPQRFNACSNRQEYMP